MKKLVSFASVFLFFIISILSGQNVEVQGKLKVSKMDTTNDESLLVVKQPDGTLSTRILASLPNPPDTNRTLHSDFLLASYLCNCSSLSPGLINSLLNSGYSVQDLLEFQIPIQDLLNADIDPNHIINGGAVLSDFIGLNYAGGIIFYLEEDGSGLVSAQSDQSVGAAWGCRGLSIVGADGSAIGTGDQNTTDIDLRCSTPNIAADICINLSLNGFSDWFLPSKDELHEMWLKIGQGATGTNANVGAFGDGYYWSSTEYSPSLAWRQYFVDGTQEAPYKDFYHRVRAIRSFNLFSN